MIFTVENGFRPEAALGYDALGLNRLNNRFNMFMAPFKTDIAGSRILDLASCDGRWSYAALALGADHVTGIEGRTDSIEKGRHLFADSERAGRSEFIVGDIFDVMPRLQTQGRSFDVILCLGIFYHVMDHFRLLRLIADFNPKLVILDTGLVDDEKPYIALRTETNHSPMNAIAISGGADESVVGVVSKGGLRLMSRSIGYDITFLEWKRSNFSNRLGLHDYFGATPDNRRRFSAILRKGAKS